MKIIELDERPSLAGQYARALSQSLRPGRMSGSLAALPSLEVRARRVDVDRMDLGAWCRVCQTPQGRHLPLAYPQVLATSLHGVLLVQPGFPFGVLGLIHRRNTVRQHHAIPVGVRLELAARFGTAHVVAHGTEFEILTTVTAHGACVWESSMVVLARHKHEGERQGDGDKKARGRGPESPQTVGDAPGRSRSLVFALSEDTGRRYARASGDYNPIHLHATTARLFGFGRPIVQGMWSFARCLAELGDDYVGERAEATVEFRRAIAMPSRLLFSSGPQASGWEFALRTPDGARTYVAGWLGPQADSP